MSLITMYSATIAVLNFLILWGGIHFLSRWIPPNADDEMPVWKSGVMAAAIDIFAMLFIGLAMSVITPSGG